MKLFSHFVTGDQFAIGVRMKEGDFNLTRAFDIYQKAQGARRPVSIPFLQMLVEMGYCSAGAIETVMGEAWVQSKLEEIRIGPDPRFDVPVARPSKIICLGRNYEAHAREFRQDIPEEPIFFAKAPSSMVPHGEPVVIPRWLTERVDHEGELAFIIGKPARNVPEDQASEFIAGYTILNDITARSMQARDMKAGRPWFASKSLDTFCPVGPFIVPADSIGDPHDLTITVTVNGTERQKASTGDMIFRIPEIVARLSRLMTLQPGDIVATGTPEGVSPIQPGDRVKVAITGLGVLENPVVQEGG